jgi:hypothetical protein
VPAVSDPCISLATRAPDGIPTNTCATYYSEPTKKNRPNLPASQRVGGIRCHDNDDAGVHADYLRRSVQVQGNVTLQTASPGSVLVIRNGVLDIGGYVLKTDTDSTLVIIFSGPDPSGSYNHYPLDGSGSASTDCTVRCINIPGPDNPVKGSRDLPGPQSDKKRALLNAGSSPTWDVTGLIYLPHANGTFKCAVNKSSYVSPWSSTGS